NTADPILSHEESGPPRGCTARFASSGRARSRRRPRDAAAARVLRMRIGVDEAPAEDGARGGLRRRSFTGVLLRGPPADRDLLTRARPVSDLPRVARQPDQRV